MYLLINSKGAKYWRLKYWFGGKEKTLALGVYPEVSLAEARDHRSKARAKLRDGIDPGVARRLERINQYEEEVSSFRALATVWYKTRISDKSESYKDRTWRLLKNDLFPPLGNRPINQIIAPELLMALRKIEARGAVDMAHRAKQTAGQVFRYAVATGRAERDPSADFKGALKSRTKKHYAAITEPKEVGPLLVAIDGFIGTPVVKAALQLSPILFQRPGEMRAMEWAEIDFLQGCWEIPAEKMKMGQPHIVPLPRQAIEMLREHQRLTGRGRYVFPSARGGSPH